MSLFVEIYLLASHGQPRPRNKTEERWYLNCPITRPHDQYRVFGQDRAVLKRATFPPADIPTWSGTMAHRRNLYGPGLLGLDLADPNFKLASPSIFFWQVVVVSSSVTGSCRPVGSFFLGQVLGFSCVGLHTELPSAPFSWDLGL